MAQSTRAAGLVLVAALTWSGISKADLTPDEMARQHFESGVAYLQESDLDAALNAFQKAYELSGRPKILLNLATVHERMGQPGLAADDLEKYLTLEPESPDRATLEVRIKNLRKRAEEAPPPVSPAAGPAATPAAEARPTTEPATQPVAVATAPVASEEPNRVPAIIAFGIAGGAAAGVLVTQILAHNERDDLESSCAPACTDGDTSGGRALAWTSLGLGALAIVGTGVGAALWFGADSEHEEVGALPRVRLDAGLEGADARATWSF